jgi:hypothetical protein
MTRIRLDYVHEFRDRRGRVRRYFRRPGYKQMPLPGLPGSAEFMEAYQAALAGQTVAIGTSHTKPGTVAAVVAAYFASPGFLSLEPITQREYRRILEKFRAEHGDKPGAQEGVRYVSATQHDDCRNRTEMTMHFP